MLELMGRGLLDRPVEPGDDGVVCKGTSCAVKFSTIFRAIFDMAS
jgi:hypothetical protein